MILFLAKQIGGTNGNAEANLDILISLLLSGKKIGTISFTQSEIPKFASDQPIPNPLSIISSKTGRLPQQQTMPKILSKINEHEIELVLNNDLAFL